MVFLLLCLGGGTEANTNAKARQLFCKKTRGSRNDETRNTTYYLFYMYISMYVYYIRIYYLQCYPTP